MLQSFIGHQAELANLPPGSSISTSISGTTVTLPRTFNPSLGLLDPSPSNLIAPGTPFSRLYFATFREPQTKIVEKSTIVVSIDGACSDNGTPAARAAVGVYFGPESPHNISERIGGVQTSQRAEIRAAIRALEIVTQALLDDFSVRRVVLLCDSSYVVQSMTEWVFKWRENGWKNARNGSVVNTNDLKELDEFIDKLCEEGLDVEFWLVGREKNVLADELANRACK
jgi:ribonuclease HI